VEGDGARGHTLREAGMRALNGLVTRDAAVCRRVRRCPQSGVETGAGRSAIAPSPPSLARAGSRCRRGREAGPAPICIKLRWFV